MSTCQVNDFRITGSNPGSSTYSVAANAIGESGPGGTSNYDGDCVPLVEEPPEILGSVVQSHELENGDKNSSVQLRTSARVSKKMRLDVIANQAPPERKDVPKEGDKHDTKPKRRPFELWPQEDKNTFFEALNEFGKDFDAIQRYFEAKAKRKNLLEHTVKNKEQIRHFYYRTWHKISKHLRFPEEVKKATQELYGLINFGELRKKIGSVSEKTSLRLNELIYRGFTTIRVRGKNIRVKTPICRALRKLNQQEDLVDNLKLPARVTVELRPRTNEAWAQVQAMAQNPRVETLLPLQRRLLVLLNFLKQRWKPHTLKHCEKLQLQLNEVTANMESSLETLSSSTAADAGPSSEAKQISADSEISCNKKVEQKQKQILRIAPKHDLTITPLTINLSEYFTSSRLSLNSHEGRLGNHGAEQLFNSMLHASSKGCGRRGAKRQRNDSSSEKKKEQLLSQSHIDSSPEKSKDGSQTGIFNPVDSEDDKPSCPFRIFGSGINLDACSSSVDSGHGDGKVNGDTSASSSKTANLKEDGDNAVAGGSTNGSLQDNAIGSTQTNALNSTESNEEIIKRVRAGWTEENANAVTIGELYLMFGADSKVKMEYWWEDQQGVKAQDALTDAGSEAEVKLDTPGISNAESSNEKSPDNPNPLSSTLRKLVSITKMYSAQAKCPCGHVCNGLPKTAVSKTKINRPTKGAVDVEKTLKPEVPFEVPNGSPKLSSPSMNDGPFRRPLMPSPHFKPPPRPGTADAFKAQLEKFRPRGCNRRGRPVTVKKNVVVPRMLPLLPKAPQSQVVTFQVIPQGAPVAGEFLPIAQSPSILNFTPTSSPSIVQSSMSQFVQKVSESPSQATATTSHTSSNSKLKPQEADMNISMPDLCEEAQPPQISVQGMTKESRDSQPKSCHLVQDLFPPTLDTPVNSPPSISNLLDLSLPSELGLNSSSLMETNFTGLLSNAGVSASLPPASPSTLLKDDESQWLNTEDFSLSSFLGHLESPMKATSDPSQDNHQPTSISSDVETHMQCLMTDSSLDYVAKFADLAAQIGSDGASKG